jgi:hypothetical protein
MPFRSRNRERCQAQSVGASRIHRRKLPGRPMPRQQLRTIAAKSPERAQVEHPFAQEKAVIACRSATITLSKMADTMKRWGWLDTQIVPR